MRGMWGRPVRSPGIRRRLAIHDVMRIGKRSPFGIGRIVVALMRAELAWALRTAKAGAGAGLGIEPRGPGV